jgi:hypothetical protein
MSPSMWNERCQLAERYARDALMDVPTMTDAEIHGLLLWLRSMSVNDLLRA